MITEKKLIAKLKRHSENKDDTWPKVLAYNGRNFSRRQAMRKKHYGIWHPVTWEDYYLNVKYLSLGLLRTGFRAEDKLLIIGDNAPEWFYSELAAHANHGVSVGIYPDLTPEEIRYIAGNSDASFAVVEDQEQVDKILEIKNELPLLKKIIYWNYKGLADYNDPILTGFREVIQLGMRHAEDHPGLFEQNVADGKGDDICALVYTSGTKEPPKGAMHSFNTLRAGAESYLKLDPWIEDDNIIPYRPPAGINGQLFGIGCHLLSASILNFAETPDTLRRDAKETSPSIVFFIARQWENLAASIHARMFASGRLKRFFFGKLMPFAYKRAELYYKKIKPRPFRKFLYFLGDIILYNFIKKDMGLKNARICYATDAVLSPEAIRFYHALDLPLKSIYATTEAGALSGAYSDDIRADSIGHAHEGIEIKISDEGELVCRQPGIFLGYYKNPEKTSEVLKDGWLYSGDCCSIRDDGHIRFVEKREDLIELADGSTLAPQSIECRLRFSPYITDAWILAGTDRSFVSAIIVINYINVGRWAGQNRIAFSGFTELSQKPEVYDLIEKDIVKINSSLPKEIQIKKYVNLHRTFSPDEAELTRSRKLRRLRLEERYSGIIDAIYGGKPRVPVAAGIESGERRNAPVNINLNIKSINNGSEI